MKSFLQYLKFRENDGEVQKVASPGEMPMAKASGDDAEPIVPGDGSNQRVLEMLKNSFNKFLDEKLPKAVERKKITKEDALSLLNTEISRFSNTIGIDANSVSPTNNNAMTTNSEPMSPVPNQPKASG